MEIEITQIILKHGLPFVIMAIMVMSIIGIVKIFTKGIVNKKVVTEKQKKWLSKLYLALSLVLSYIATLIYYSCILGENCWTTGAVRDAGIIWTITSPLYQLYKQFGGRKLLIFIVSYVQQLNKGKNKNVDDILSIVMQIIEEDAPLLTNTQKETIQNNIKGALNGEEKKEE